LAFTNIQTIAAVKFINAAKSRAFVHPSEVAMLAVKIGAIPPAMLAQVFISPDKAPE
jgi:hypothetical protein